MPKKTHQKFRVCLIQMNASANWQENLDRLEKKLLPSALRLSPDLIVLPEAFIWRGASGQMTTLASCVTPVVLKTIKIFCRQNKVYVLCGSLAESVTPKKYYNTSYLISDKGKMIGKYRKIHLFDINLGKRLRIRESKEVLAGNKVVVSRVKGVKVGLSICYDLRFPELYRQLAKKGAEVVFVPANFTDETGKVHWEVLLRARAIENQLYVVAPAQSGKNRASGVKSYGTSMVVSPWGEVLVKAPHRGEVVVACELDFASQKILRRQFPVLGHTQLT